MLQHPLLYQRKWNSETVVQQRMSGNQQFQGGLVGLRGPGKLSSGQFSPSNGPAGPGSPSILNPQQRHARCEENFCGAELAPREQKFIHCAFAARESRRDERQRRGGSRKGVLRARKTGRWPVFTEERAGRPWLCPPFEGCATAPRKERISDESVQGL